MDRVGLLDRICRENELSPSLLARKPTAEIVALLRSVGVTGPIDERALPTWVRQYAQGR